VHPSEQFAYSLLLAGVLLRFPEEASLIERLQARDPGAMSELYDRYGRVTFSVILRIVRDRATAEDLLQESFLRVWNRASVLDAQKGRLGPWLLTVARNQALDYVRSVEGRTWSTMASADTERTALLCDAEGVLIEAVDQERLRKAIGKLNERQRLLVEMAYFEGLTQPEMAERIQQPLGTVKTWMRGALKVLRDELTAPANL
jgi:RNA polymerase sigma-70 factor (ECF subfamily)